MTDIMADFKDTKFKVVENEFDDSFEHLVVLCDLDFWYRNYDELIQWSNDNRCEVLGMTVNIIDDETLTLFLLRWQ